MLKNSIATQCLNIFIAKAGKLKIPLKNDENNVNPIILDCKELLDLIRSVMNQTFATAMRE